MISTLPYWLAVDPKQLNAAMVGAFDTIPLASLLRWLHAGGRDALVRVESDGKGGAVLLRAGEVRHASWGQATGEEALRAMCVLPQGSFALFKGDLPALGDNVLRGTAAVLLAVAPASPEPPLPRSIRLRAAGEPLWATSTVPGEVRRGRISPPPVGGTLP